MRAHLSHISAPPTTTPAAIPAPTPITVPVDGTVVLSGYGLRISVSRRHLALADGVGRNRRAGRLHKATSRLQRLVIIGHTGFITLEAMRWLADVGCAFAQIDADGRVVACFTPSGAGDVRIRVRQAQAAVGPQGIRIAQELIRQKAEGQLAVLDHVEDSGDARSAIAEVYARLSVETADELRWLESVAASVYWQRLAALEMRFARSDLVRVPGHWRTVGARHSTLSNAPRNAVTPAHAILNYLFAVCETEARVASVAAGLDPEVGLLHSLRRYRSSLAADLMEPVRPVVERYWLDLLRSRTFSARDFVETREGGCRLAPPLPEIITRTGPLWAAALRPVVQQVLRELEKREPGGVQTAVPTARLPGGLRRQTPHGGEARPPSMPLQRCADCGRHLKDARSERCQVCERARLADGAPELGGPDKLARLRAEGHDPTHGGTAGAKRAAAAAARHAEAREWRAGGAREPANGGRFEREVLPLLRDVPLRAMVDATGLSKPQCSMIKRGLRVPHERHWEALLTTVQARPEVSRG